MITLNDYLKEVEEQNIFLLSEMSKYPKNSKIYKHLNVYKHLI